jgi:YD repeat-containing protein
MGGELQLDAVLLLPLISSLRLGRGLLLVSVDGHTRSVDLPAAATSYSYDSTGRLHSRRSTARPIVLPGGFTVVC